MFFILKDNPIPPEKNSQNIWNFQNFSLSLHCQKSLRRHERSKRAAAQAAFFVPQHERGFILKKYNCTAWAFFGTCESTQRSRLSEP